MELWPITFITIASEISSGDVWLMAKKKQTNKNRNTSQLMNFSFRNLISNLLQSPKKNIPTVFLISFPDNKTFPDNHQKQKHEHNSSIHKTVIKNNNTKKDES